MIDVAHAKLVRPLHFRPRRLGVTGVEPNPFRGGSAEEVEGLVVEANEREWKLSMLRVEQRGGASVDWNREVVTFPRSALMRPSQKTLDKPKSWMLAGGIVAGAILAGQVFKSLGADDNTDNNPPPASILLLPFRFR